MSSVTKRILLACSNIKSLFESNISTSNSIKQLSDEIFQIVSGRPLPNRIDLISKKTTTIIRKEKTLINTNKELSSNIDKIEKIILELLKLLSNSQQLNDEDIYKELSEGMQRKNNELTKMRNMNDNLNNEIIKLKNMLNATGTYGKFSNSELIDIYQNEKLFIEAISIPKKEKEVLQKKKSTNTEKKENKLKNAEQKKSQKNEKDNKESKENKENKDNKDNKENKENKQLKDQIQKQNEEIKKLKEELSLVNNEKAKLSEELKNKESSDNNSNSKFVENEKELKKLQDNFIKLTLENEERKASISNKDSLIKDLMKDCDDKKN